MKSVSYNIVPISEISDFYITDVSKLGVTTSYSLEDNGNGIENIRDANQRDNCDKSI